jgi:carbonic anhydrase
MKTISGEHASGRKIPSPRRLFLKAAVMGGGGGAFILMSSPGLRGVRAAGHTDILLLSCMDYRLVDHTARYMTRCGLRNKYDHVVLAGAALGAVTDKYPDWNQTFWDELSLASDLHHIHKVMILDHRDCGAYKQILGEDFARQPKKETEVHAAQLKRLRQLINEKYEHLEVELLLMNLAGKVEQI